MPEPESSYEYFAEHVCPVCKKEFLTTTSKWVYKYVSYKKTRHQTLYFCSWKCQRAYEIEHNIKGGLT